MAQPAPHKSVALSEEQLMRSSGYVSRVSVAGIDQRRLPPPPEATGGAAGATPTGGGGGGGAAPMDVSA